MQYNTSTWSIDIYFKSYGLVFLISHDSTPMYWFGLLQFYFSNFFLNQSNYFHLTIIFVLHSQHYCCSMGPYSLFWYYPFIDVQYMHHLYNEGLSIDKQSFHILVFKTLSTQNLLPFLSYSQNNSTTTLWRLFTKRLLW